MGYQEYVRDKFKYFSDLFIAGAFGESLKSEVITNEHTVGGGRIFRTYRVRYFFDERTKNIVQRLIKENVIEDVDEDNFYFEFEVEESITKLGCKVYCDVLPSPSDIRSSHRDPKLHLVLYIEVGSEELKYEFKHDSKSAHYFFEKHKDNISRCLVLKQYSNTFWKPLSTGCQHTFFAPVLPSDIPQNLIADLVNSKLAELV